MDLILSAVFGLQANSQDNPDDPFIKAARQALKQSFSKKILLGSLVPFGIKIMENFPSIWLSNASPLLKMTEKIISVKKTGNGGSSRKVRILYREFIVWQETIRRGSGWFSSRDNERVIHPYGPARVSILLELTN